MMNFREKRFVGYVPGEVVEVFAGVFVDVVAFVPAGVLRPVS
jgi:hypothetical protein